MLFQWGGKLEDHYYIGNFADTDRDRGTVLTITVPASVRKNKPIQYAFAVSHYDSDSSPKTVNSKYMSQNNNERSCTITGEGTFTIQTGRSTLGTNYIARFVSGTYIVFFSSQEWVSLSSSNHPSQQPYERRYINVNKF